MKIIKKNKIIIHMVISFVAAIILSGTALSQYFHMALPKSTIVIEDTATKNEASAGTDIRLKSVKINGELIPLDELRQDGTWESVDGLLIAINPAAPTTLGYTIENAKTLEIELQKHVGSGIVSIQENNREIGRLDLYSSDWEEVKFTKNLGIISIREHLGLFSIVFLGLFILLSSLKEVIRIVKEKKTARMMLIGILLLFVAFFTGSIHYSNYESLVNVGMLFAFLGTITVRLCGMLEKTDRNGLKNCCIGMVLIMSSILMFYLTEQINGGLKDMPISYTIGNISIYLTIFLTIYMVVRRLSAAVIMGVVLLTAFAIANYYVTLFRGSPIVPGDFFIIGTAKTVFRNYHYTVTWDMFGAVIFVMTWCISITELSKAIGKTKKEQVLVWGLPLALLGSGIIGFDFFEPSLDMWNQNNNINKYGVAMSLLSGKKSMSVSAPKGYTYDYVEELMGEHNPVETNKEMNPNIIVIMNESFSDLSVISETLDSNLYMPYYNSLSENSVKGKALVSTIGGGTANTEYEFLTGNSMAFVPGAVPYQQYIVKDSFSLAKVFKECGYATSAIHAYDKKGYNRQKVYPLLGFDEFLGIDDFDNPQLSRGRYTTDEESYKKVIEVFKQNQSNNLPAFIFNVTIQNHSDYTTGFYGADSIKVPEYEGKFGDIEEYLTLMKESDDAFKILIDFFASIQAPTVILMFGDHQPKVDDAFYETMVGKPYEEWSLEEAQKRYEVPFFIWANYDIDEKTDVYTSMNYLSSLLCKTANIASTPYQRFLLNLAEDVPAMNMGGYLGSDNIWHTYSEENEYSNDLSDYWMIQYSNMFDKRSNKDWFLGAGELSDESK